MNFVLRVVWQSISNVVLRKGGWGISKGGEETSEGMDEEEEEERGSKSKTGIFPVDLSFSYQKPLFQTNKFTKIPPITGESNRALYGI